MKAGTIFILTTGEYSDFGIFATLRATEDFDFDHAVEDYKRANPNEAKQYNGDQQRFLEGLINAQLVEEVVLPRLHLASYSTFETNPEATSREQFKNPETWILGCLEHDDCKQHPELGAVCERRCWKKERQRT